MEILAYPFPTLTLQRRLPDLSDMSGSSAITLFLNVSAAGGHPQNRKGSRVAFPIK